MIYLMISMMKNKTILCGLSYKSPGVDMVFTIRLADCGCCSDSNRDSASGTHGSKRRNNMMA